MFGGISCAKIQDEPTVAGKEEDNSPSRGHDRICDWKSGTFLGFSIVSLVLVGPKPDKWER